MRKLPRTGSSARLKASIPNGRRSRVMWAARPAPASLPTPSSLRCTKSVRVFPGAGCQLAKQEFLHKTVDHAAARGDQGVFEHQAGSAIGIGIIRIRDCSRNQIATDTGVIRLPFAIVALADEGTLQSV